MRGSGSFLNGRQLFLLLVVTITLACLTSTLLAQDLRRAHKDIIVKEWFPRYLSIMGSPFFAKLYDIDTTDTKIVDSLRSAFMKNNIARIGSLPTIFRNVHLERYKVSTREHKTHYALLADYGDKSRLLPMDTIWPYSDPSPGSVDYDSNFQYLDTAFDISLSIASFNELIFAEGPRAYTSAELRNIIELLFFCRDFVDGELPLTLLTSWNQSVNDIGLNHSYVTNMTDSVGARKVSLAYKRIIQFSDEISEHHKFDDLELKITERDDGFVAEAYVYFYESGFIGKLRISFRKNVLAIISKEIIGRNAFDIDSGL